MVALSGGVDSAVAAMLLRDAGHRVQCLHMTNWEDDDGYCAAAEDFQDARKVCEQLELPLHRVNFTREYHDQVFAHFLDESRHGRTPNPDVLCNREIKFGVLSTYAGRLGAAFLATGHYARLKQIDGQSCLFKALDLSKDQSYFLHAVSGNNFANVLFPLGDYLKQDVRELARAAGITISEKKDSTGICFIGERPFAEFLQQYLPPEPGEIRSSDGHVLGTHQGLAYYTLGQRQGLGIGGVQHCREQAWYVADKDLAGNALIVVQGREHPRLYQNWASTGCIHWINPPPREWKRDNAIACQVKTRYRQPDQAATLLRVEDNRTELLFEEPQWAVTPGQYAVFYKGEQYLGGARILATEQREINVTPAMQSA